MPATSASGERKAPKPSRNFAPSAGTAQITAPFDAVITHAGIAIVKTPPRAPRANSFAERWAASARRECTDRLLITGRRHLTTVLDAYVEHYNRHRPTSPWSSDRPSHDEWPCLRRPARSCTTGR
jgi:transposase InsO family protein